MLQRLRSLLSSCRRPPTVDWTFDQDALLERIRGSIVEQYGHVYLCIPDLLPAPLYDACMAYWPRDDQFEQRAHSRTRITLAWLDQAPLDENSRAFWHRFGHEVVNGKIKPALIRAFTPYIRQKFDFLPEDSVAEIEQQMSFVDYLHEGLNLDKGFSIGPHVDQNYIFVSSLFYMPPDTSQRHMGTTLYQPLDPSLRTMDTTFVDEAALRPVYQFPFTPNTLASFLQSPVAFHGYSGKKSARLRRSYQFNVHMNEATVVRAYGKQANTEPVYASDYRKAS